jgi:hypothetical protein
MFHLLLPMLQPLLPPLRTKTLAVKMPTQSHKLVSALD